MLSNYSAHTPILNKTSEEHFRATFQKDCGNDDLCQSNLILIGEVTEGKRKFKLAIMLLMLKLLNEKRERERN